MSDILSSAEGSGSLHTKLKQGLEGDYDIHGKDKTTANISWIKDFEHDVKDFGSSNEYWSQTESEMIFAKEAITNIRMFMRGSGMGWTKPMNNLIRCIELGSNEREAMVSKVEKGISFITGINLDHKHETDYRLSVLKEDFRKMSSDESNYGMSKSKRVRIGTYITVVNNKSLFSPNTISRASENLDKVEYQVEGVREDAKDMCIKCGKVAGEAKVNDVLHEDYWDKTLGKIDDSYPNAKEYILKGFNEVVG